MEPKIIQELSEVVQSSNINFLLGAGIYRPYLPLLGNIENNLNATDDLGEKEKFYKEYLTQVMLPNLPIVKDKSFDDTNFLKTKKSLTDFFTILTNILLKRKSTILSKQINLFTTNIDVLLETGLEELGIEYNDGFAGRFTPSFSLANFKKSIYQRSLHFEHISEIPVFNIIKLHGSLTWVHDNAKEKILFSHALKHISDSLSTRTGKAFRTEYNKILVVNPEESKHLESVLNVYYSELLRLYSSELEKENACLFIVGFSMEDKHIREITLRAAKSNPTLRVFICCSQKKYDEMCIKMDTTLHQNIQIFTPDIAGKFFTVDYLNEEVLKQLTLKKISDKDV